MTVSSAIAHSCWLLFFSSTVNGSPVGRSEEDKTKDHFNLLDLTKVCTYENAVFSNGENFTTDNPCETCVCHPPGFSCSLVSCETSPGCKAIHTANTCCPTYLCDCEIAGKVYLNGEKVEDGGPSHSPCETCFCKGGAVECVTVSCYTREDCEPKLMEGWCCPKYDHCPPLETMKENMTFLKPGNVFHQNGDSDYSKGEGSEGVKLSTGGASTGAPGPTSSVATLEIIEIHPGLTTTAPSPSGQLEIIIREEATKKTDYEERAVETVELRNETEVHEGPTTTETATTTDDYAETITTAGPDGVNMEVDWAELGTNMTLDWAIVQSDGSNTYRQTSEDFETTMLPSNSSTSHQQPTTTPSGNQKDFSWELEDKNEEYFTNESSTGGKQVYEVETEITNVTTETVESHTSLEPNSSTSEDIATVTVTLLVTHSFQTDASLQLNMDLETTQIDEVVLERENNIPTVEPATLFSGETSTLSPIIKNPGSNEALYTTEDTSNSHHNENETNIFTNESDYRTTTSFETTILINTFDPLRDVELEKDSVVEASGISVLVSEEMVTEATIENCVDVTTMTVIEKTLGESRKLCDNILRGSNIALSNNTTETKIEESERTIHTTSYDVENITLDDATATTSSVYYDVGEPTVMSTKNATVDIEEPDEVRHSFMGDATEEESLTTAETEVIQGEFEFGEDSTNGLDDDQSHHEPTTKDIDGVVLRTERPEKLVTGSTLTAGNDVTHHATSSSNYYEMTSEDNITSTENYLKSKALSFQDTFLNYSMPDESPLARKSPISDENFAPILTFNSEQFKFLQLGEEQPLYVKNSESATESRTEHTAHPEVIIMPTTTPLTVEMVKVVDGKMPETNKTELNIESTTSITVETVNEASSPDSTLASTERNV